MRAVLLLSLLLTQIVSAAAQTSTGELEGRLDARVPQYTVRAKGLADAILRIAKQFELPVGIEWLKDNESLRGLDLTWKGATVREILSSVVERYPPYSYRVEGGIVHVFRPDLLDDSLNFLNLRVPESFEVRQELGGFANVMLRMTVQDIVSPRNLPPGAGWGGSYTSGNVPEKPLTLTLRGLTIREALERLAEASEHKIWVVTFSGGADLTPTGFRRTETLWHPTPFPDRDQPMWDFLAWREYMPEPAPAAPSPPR
jgi:hypothetical protein